MFIYYCLFFWVAFNNLTKSRALQILTIFCLILIVGLRFKVGGDWESYAFMYDIISKNNINFSLTFTDPAYGIINYLSNMLNKDVWLVNLICATIFFIGIDYFSKFTPHYWISLLTSLPYIIITVSMGYTRQSAAIGLVLIAFVNLMKNNKFNFLFWILLALTFHKSSILLLIFTPYAFNYKFTRIKNIIYMSLFIVTLFIIMNSSITQDSLYFTDEFSSSGAISRMIVHIPAIILYLVYRKKFENFFRKNLVILDTFLILIVIFFSIAFFYSTFADRFNLYFYIFDMLILSTFTLFLNRSNYYVYLLLIILYQFTLLSLWLNFSPYADCCWIPYQNYLWNT